MELTFLKRIWGRKPYYRIHFFIVLLALLITFISFYLFPFPITPHKVHYKIQGHNPYLIPYYHDFDHDGFSEKIELKHNPVNNRWAIKGYTVREQLIDQWNFLEKWLVHPIFGDFNNDHHDEVYVFTHTYDSLFLYGLDIREKEFFLYRKFIFRAPQPLPPNTSVWDLDRISGLLIDTNGDEIKELVVQINAGFALQPRKIIIYSIQQQKILAQSPLAGIKLGIIKPFDYNHDRKLEFAVSTHTSNNYHQPVPFSDNYSWLIAFDNNLNFLFSPIRFYPAYSRVNTFPVEVNKKTFIVGLIQYLGKLDLPPKLVLVNMQGEIVREKILPPNEEYKMFSLTQENKKQLYFLTVKSRKIFKLDSQLNYSEVAQFKQSVDIPLPFDLDLDFEPELMFFSKKQIVITEMDFKERYYIPVILNNTYGIHPQIQKRGLNPPQLIFMNKNDQLFSLTYTTNPFYPYRYLFRLGVFFLYFFFLEGLWSLIRYYQFTRSSLQHFLGSTRNGVLILTHNGRIIQVNAQLEKTLGLKQHIQLQRPYSEALRERPEVVQFLLNLINENRPIHQPIQFSLAEEEFIGEISAQPIPGILNIPLGYFVEIKENLPARMLPERIRLWSKTVQKMAHDIKTPLSTIQLSLRTLEMKIRDLAQAQFKQLHPDFEIINSELQKVRTITRDFLKFTNLEQLQFQYCSLQEIIENALSHFSNYLNSKINVQLELDSQHDRIWADPQQLSMVFQIIIENAIDAMQGEGQIMITSNLAQYLDKNLRSYLEIEIADTGPGIPETDLEKVFEPYYTTKKEGTGMGLAIARKIIEDHQGEITIVSRKDFATVVRIVLPIENIGGNDLG